MRKLKLISARTYALIIKAVTLLLVLFAIFMLFQINSQGRQTAKRANEIATQNKAIAEENQRHIDCIANLFAKYTRDNRAITISDLDACQATTDDAQSPSPSVTGTAPVSPSISTPSAATAASPDPTLPPQASPKAVEVLGIPVCVPTTGICVMR